MSYNIKHIVLEERRAVSFSCGRSNRMLALVFALLIALVVVPAGVYAQTYHDLYDFDCGNGNGGPGCAPTDFGSLAQGPDGNLYGTTSGNGDFNFGTIFMVTPSGTRTQLWSFDGPTGEIPNAGLTLASDGNFYGTASRGGALGNGTLFRFTPPNTVVVLHSFGEGPDGIQPEVPPVEAKDGNLYGITDTGTTYRVTLPAGVFKSFPQSAPELVQAPLVLGLDGNLYGTTMLGGRYERGTVFRMTTEGAIKVIHSFKGPDGSVPVGPLTYGSGGNLLGTTGAGGVNGTGTIFKMTLTGQLTTLHSFATLNGGVINSDGNGPLAGLLYASDGNLYGSTARGGADGNGTLFQITPQGSFTKLFDFTQGAGDDGAMVWTTLMEHTNGSYYGLTARSGVNTWGNFYSLVSAAQTPILKVVGSIWVTPGQAVEILGDDLTQVKNVSFGLVPAQFRIGSDTFMIATVPNAAIDGALAATLTNGDQVKTFMSVHILPVVSGFSPASGAVGSQVSIAGGGFTGATKVTFGGVATTQFTVSNATQIVAKVPAGAKTGRVEVTTPNGMAASKKTFKVN
jgi:uncharacterized repeat protein (TIGR03803 family)